MNISRRIGLLAVAGVALSVGAAIAHDGHDHLIMGTVTARDERHLEVKTPSGEVLSIDRLLQEAWGADVFLTDRVVYTHVNNLRSKIEPDPRHPRHIVSVRGVGYRFQE